MGALLQNLINAITISSSYALIAVGFTLIFGVLRVVYLCHAAVAAACAYVGYAIMMLTGNVIVALIGGTLCGTLLGVLIERIAIRPVRGQDHLIPMVTTISAAVVIEESLRILVAGGQAISYPEAFTSYVVRFNIAGAKGYFTVAQALIAVLSLALVLGLTLIVKHTWMGRSIRAIADNEQVAALLGIRVNTTSSRTVALSSTLAGAAGVLLALSLSTINPLFAAPLQFKALAIVLFAGMGSIPGAVLGAYLLGFIEVVAMAYLDSAYRDLYAFGVMMIILMIRPQGLLGSAVAQRV